MSYDTDIPQGRPPAGLSRIPADRVVLADVREELRQGREPFAAIMAARAQVGEDGALCVRAVFEPVPLYGVLGRQGFAHWTEQLAQDDWRVWFYREAEAAPAAGPAPAPADAEDAGIVVLDVRGLEPPEPMVRTLAALETLPPGGTLVQLNTRVPQFLLPLLEERGFRSEVQIQNEDLVRLFIRHA